MGHIYLPVVDVDGKCKYIYRIPYMDLMGIHFFSWCDFC